MAGAVVLWANGGNPPMLIFAFFGCPHLDRSCSVDFEPKSPCCRKKVDPCACSIGEQTSWAKNNLGLHVFLH